MNSNFRTVREDFFLNGSLTSRSQVPNLLAAIWTGGRETLLVSDQLDRATKEAMTATLSAVNDCPYCGDMLISLVHSGDRHDEAEHILAKREEHIGDPLLRDRLIWVKAVATPGATPPKTIPFSKAQLPEAIGSLMAMSDINRFSHIVMDGSPVNAPFGLDWIKAAALRIFGGELRATHIRPLEPGRSLHWHRCHRICSGPKLVLVLLKWLQNGLRLWKKKLKVLFRKAPTNLCVTVSRLGKVN